MKVNLSSIESVNKFYKIIYDFPVEADLISGRYVVNAKSIMGIFSLDLSKPINIVFHGNISKNDYEKIKEFIVE